MGYAIARSTTDENLVWTYVLFLAYGVPLLYVAVTTPDEPSSVARRVVDGSLLLLLMILAYLGVRDITDANGVLTPEHTYWGVIAFDIENVLLFLTFLIRYLTAIDEREHRFFGLVTGFLGLYAICAGLHNHDELYPDSASLQRVTDILPTIPFVALLCLLHAARQPRAFQPPDRRWARPLSVSLAPALLLAAIFALSLGIGDTQGAFGRAMLAVAMLVYVVRITQTHYWFALTRDQLADALATVERVSLLDELTGIPNRRAFDKALVERSREVRRHGKPLSALMIDVDHFKAYNDTQGHPEGDIALRAVARLLAGALRRPADFIARYGGEEFVVLLPGADPVGAQVVARRMNRAIYDAYLDHPHGIDGRITVSIGLASSASPEKEGLIALADRALYDAKHAGRNRFAEPPTENV
jgi:diguanylate cyclase (GGDEF)-like protein